MIFFGQNNHFLPLFTIYLLTNNVDNLFITFNYYKLKNPKNQQNKGL